MKFEFNDGFLLAGGKVIAEINALEENSIDTLSDSKMSAGVSRIIHEKNELQLKYDRLLKDYELSRHEIKQKDVYIKELEEKQEKLLRELENLRGEKTYVLEMCKNSEGKLLAIKEIIYGN
jgi:vacuolar-type H+-ATPase subunit I/STV1